jgi:hypothetical protein
VGCRLWAVGCGARAIGRSAPPSAFCLPLSSRKFHAQLEKVFDATEGDEFERQKRLEAEARKLIEAGREAEAVKLLQQFINDNCARADKEYRQLNQTLPARLEKTGIEYLFTDYVRGWTSKHGVPLPLR